MPSKDGKRLKEQIITKVDTVEEEDWSEEWELVSCAGKESATKNGWVLDGKRTQPPFHLRYRLRCSNAPGVRLASADPELPKHPLRIPRPLSRQFENTSCTRLPTLVYD